MYMHTCMWGYVSCLQRPQKGVRSPGTGMTGGWLLVVIWMLRTEPKFSGRVAGALNLNHLPSPLYTGFNFNNESVYKIEWVCQFYQDDNCLPINKDSVISHILFHAVEWSRLS